MLKNIFKNIILIFIITFWLTNFVNAVDYTYFYWESCTHCHEVLKFFEKNNIEKNFWVEKKEVYFNNENREELLEIWKNLWLSLNSVWVPFMVNNLNNNYYSWDKEIIWFFKQELEKEEKNVLNLSFLNSPTCNLERTNSCSDEELLKNPESEINNFWKFLLILLPAAISDSINPCAFAVLFLLLSSILSKFTSYKRAIYSWLLFSLAIFISYFLMWIWIYKVLSFSNQIFYIKLSVWILWILVWLANIKDYFWFWKWFVMEVPFSWRPKMKAILNKVISPVWAFIAWFIVSLFLLPCTSWPYLTVLGYLASESSSLNFAWYIYMLIYNIIFILPMIIITLIIWLWVKDISELKELKETHKENIHLIVWILMLLLWLYIMWELFLK